MNFLFHWEWFFVSSSDDLVQLCVDYLKEYPLLVGSGLACPVLLFDAKWSKLVFILLWDSPEGKKDLYTYLLDSPAPGFLVADERRGGETAQIQKGQKGETKGGKVSSIQNIWEFCIKSLLITFTAAFPVGVPKSPRAVREHPRLQKVLRRKRKGRKVWKRKKTRKSSRRAVKISSDLPIAMLRCWPEFLSTIMSIFRHFQNFWWRSELSHLGHHVSTKWCPFRSSRFLSRQLLIAVKAVFSCIMHSSVNEIYLLISRKQPSFNT